MGICYAAVNSVTLNLQGNANAKEQSEVFITNISCYKDETFDNNLCSSKNTLYSIQTNLRSNITLDNDINSSLTFQIIVYNSSDSMYYFEEVAYAEESDSYSNVNIIYELKDETNSLLFNKLYYTLDFNL